MGARPLLEQLLDADEDEDGDEEETLVTFASAGSMFSTPS